GFHSRRQPARSGSRARPPRTCRGLRSSRHRPTGRPQHEPRQEPNEPRHEPRQGGRVMGALLGLSLGAGLVLIGWWYVEPVRSHTPRPRRRWLHARLAEAGLAQMRPAVFVGLSAGCAAVIAVIVTLISGVWVIGGVFGLLACLL